MYSRVKFIFLLPLMLIIVLPLLANDTAKLVIQERPNIIFILSDDHSFPHLGSYNDANILKYNITPNLDVFAKQGILFERAYTTSPQCAPSRTSFFSGCSPVSIGVTRFAEPARKDVEFFTDIIRKSGYWVGLDGRNHHLDGTVEDKNPIINENSAIASVRANPKIANLNKSSLKNGFLETPIIKEAKINPIPTPAPASPNVDNPAPIFCAACKSIKKRQRRAVLYRYFLN